MMPFRLPPARKTRRELLRVWRQFTDLPRRLAWYCGATPYYDYILSRGRKDWDGVLPMSPKMAVYVVYPRDGLPPSSLTTLRHLARNGYGTVVVSNLPVSDADRSKVLTLCSRFIERPNFGYDFGAYRDGVLSLARRLHALDRLVLLNDSVWFPVHNRSNWLADAEAMGVDFAGAVSNYGTPRASHENYQEIDWQYRTDHHNFHYCSFAISLGSNILKSNGFLRFWRNFRMDNDKSRVVRRGEIGFSRWAIRSGFTHDCTCSPGDLPRILAGLDIERLKRVTARVMLPEYPEAEPAKADILNNYADTAGWRDRAEKFIMLGATSRGIGYSLPELTINEMNFPFLKKSPLRLDLPSSNISLALIAELPEEVAKDILAEATVLRQQRTEKDDAR